MNFDLHCHSSASDGLLGPGALVERAAANGVDVLALTDHDETAGLASARAEAASRGVKFIDGVEISVTWRGVTIHVVGLQIDPENATLNEGLEKLRSSRAQRAARIGEALEQAGIRGTLAGAMSYVANPNIISRTHFARFLVDIGRAPDVRSVFRHYLVRGTSGYVPHQWASLGSAVDWIRASGGAAVLAHPGRYNLGRADRRALLAEFKASGGAAIEVVTGSHTPAQFGEFAQFAREYGLLASRGSDFHGDAGSRAELGALPSLPADLRPVWHDW